MVDFILFLTVVFSFLCGVQVGAWFGGIPQWIRWVADKLDEKLKKPQDKP